MPKRRARETLLVMSPAAAKSIAFEWFLRGFEESGYSFHGEIKDLTENVALRRLIGQRFTKLYTDQNKSKK